ncbi:MAG: RluA family pseudouridine synthase [Ileibacterium sp.]|nr:RluA family pseudouridine synthase [Ileibacterium sp.]
MAEKVKFPTLNGEVEEKENNEKEPQEGLIELTIDEADAGSRLDKYICAKLDISRKRASDLLDEGRILVNGKPLKASGKVWANDKVQVDMPPAVSLEVLPEDIPLDVVYEDEDVIVINKPKGMVVHPAPGHTSGTLVNALLYHCKDLSGINGVMRPGIVHRIDKDTSGLIVAAKNDKAHEALSAQLASKECSRQYLAIVHKPFSHTVGTVNAPIGRDEKDRQKMAVTDKNAKEAVTHFTVLENFKNFAYIECKLETGRTHQIRVHMAFIGHPIAGDPKYGPRKTLPTQGQLLHAHILEFKHPKDGRFMHFEASPDQEFLSVLEELRSEQQN